jgi:REP element-mobilizing transposase RayT
MNRGIARRTVFEGREDIRFFLSGIARAVRQGRLEVHAFSVMTTHFHLLVCSPMGALSEVMRQIQLDYVRRFNRSRHRDGPLFRSRFTSKPVASIAYRRVLVRYIDRNAVQAGLCRDPREHPYGSACWYARRRGPPWLCRTWVEDEVRASLARDRYEPEDDPRVFGCATDAEAMLVQRRLSNPGSADPLDDLVHATPAGVLSWMRWKARLADGTDPGLPVVEAGCVEDALRTARDGGLELLLQGGRVDRLPRMQAGLLRDLCGATLAEIALRIDRSVSTAGELCRRHHESMAFDEAYARHAARLAQAALAIQHPRVDGQVGSDRSCGAGSA